MPVDEETRRTLNMLRSSPETAVFVKERLDSIKIVKPERIEPGSGVIWLFGTTELATGAEIETVFVVDTGRAGRHDPGRLRTYYWWVSDNWYPQGEGAGLKRLEIGEDEAFPFRWTTHIPLETTVPGGSDHEALTRNQHD